jgi:hypothetical protein
MVAQKERVGAEPGSAVTPGAVPGPSAHGPTVAPRRRHDGAVVLVYAVIATVAFGLWRLSGDQGDAPPPSVRSTVQIGADGSVDVVQHLSFATPRSRLAVSIPERSSPAEGFDPLVDDVRIRTDGRAAPGLERPLRTGETRTLAFPEPATSVDLSYSVEGVIVRARPSTRGRGLVLATPLSIEGVASIRSRLEIVRDGVLNLGCTVAGGPMTACGSDAGPRWVVARGADDPVVDVVAQVDLPDL